MLPALQASRPTSFVPPRQRGFGIYILVLILGAVATVSVVSMMTSSSLKTREQTTHAKILAESKQALIGWAITRGSSTSTDTGTDRPGDLPAPDVLDTAESTPNYDGDQETACMDGSRVNGMPLINSSVNVRCLGRLPWLILKMSLQAPTEQDAEGKMPWYAVSANLTRIDSCMAMLNPATVNLPYSGFNCASSSNLPYPWLTVRDTRGNILSSRVAFVVMLPGAVLGSQQRRASPNLGDASQFLDSMTVSSGCATPCVPGTYSNADLDNDFIAGDTSNTFNDKLLYVTIDELMGAIENHVAGAVGGMAKAAATSSYTETPPTARYFWLAPFNPAGSAYQSAAVTTTRGMLPGHAVGGSFTTGFQWAMPAITPVTRSGTVNSSEVLNYTVPAGQGSCSWTSLVVAPSTTDLLRRVQCTATVTNPAAGVTRRLITLSYTGSAPPATIPVSTDPTSANLVISPATATTPITRSVNRTTLSTVTLQITDYDDNSSSTWSWNPWTSAWQYGPPIVGYGTENAGSGFSIRTWGISYFPSLMRNWYIANEWYRFIYLAIAPGYQPGGANSCAAANSCFTVKLNGNTAASSLPGVVLSAGKTLSTSTLSQTRHNTTLGNYFEGSNNTNSGALIFDRQTPISDSFNDQVIAIAP
ncbi:MAG: hypothetical protein RLZZ445_2995 [Pseudomonadota bacterium]